MSNFFTDNADLLFTLDNLEIQEAMSLIEKDYTEAQKYDTAPESFEDALDSFHRILDVIGDVAGERIAPRARQVDEEGPKFENGVVTYHPLTVQNLDDLKAAGVMGVILPRQYGGLNFPLSVYTMMTEMVSRADASLQNLFGLQDIADTICEFGSEEQRQKYIPRFVTGEADGSMDLTEPDSGSDLQSVRLKATQDADGKWYLDGMKRFITNGCSQIHLVLARSEEGTTDGRGLSMFICEKCPQLVVRRIEHKMGIHGVATCELQFNHVPAELCGMRKRGLIKYVMSLMNGARVSISAQAVGIAEAAYREARKYASEREQFKQSIDKFPAIYDMLARMKTQLAASRALLYETTRCVDLRQAYTHLAEGAEKPDPAVREKAKLYVALCDVLTPMSKALSTESANKIAYDCIQIHGGSGFMRDYTCERLYRDARIMNIYEGTTQLQVVAAIRHVTTGTYLSQMQEYAQGQYSDEVAPLKARVDKMKEQYAQAVEKVKGFENPDYITFHARRLVEMAAWTIMSYLLCYDASKASDLFLQSANAYVRYAEARLEANLKFINDFTPDETSLYCQE